MDQYNVKHTKYSIFAVQKSTAKSRSKPAGPPDLQPAKAEERWCVCVSLKKKAAGRNAPGTRSVTGYTLNSKPSHHCSCHHFQHGTSMVLNTLQLIQQVVLIGFPDKTRMVYQLCGIWVGFWGWVFFLFGWVFGCQVRFDFCVCLFWLGWDFSLGCGVLFLLFFFLGRWIFWLLHSFQFLQCFVCLSLFLFSVCNQLYISFCGKKLQ